MGPGASSSRVPIMIPPTTTRSATGPQAARSTSARPATRKSWSKRSTTRAIRAPDARTRSGAEAADHDGQDGESHTECVDRAAVVDAVETLEEALVRVEPERREAIGRR